MRPPPDMVFSLILHTNRAIKEASADIANVRPRFWVARQAFRPVGILRTWGAPDDTES